MRHDGRAMMDDEVRVGLDAVREVSSVIRVEGSAP
jgi:hypothetical protein